MMSRTLFPLCCAITLLCLTGRIAEALEVNLQLVSSPALKVGNAIVWTAEANDTPIDYQFSIAPVGQGFTVVHDFSNSNNRFEWTPMNEGSYIARLVARRSGKGALASAEAGFHVESRIGADGNAVVSASAHPLVFLYSAPPCDVRAMTAEFVKLNSFDDPTITDAKICDRATSMNFWIAGLEENRDYTIRYRLWNDQGESVFESQPATFRTGDVTASFPAVQVLKQDPLYMDLRRGLMLQSLNRTAGPGGVRDPTPVARKLDGTLVWYYDSMAHGAVNNLLRPLGQGLMMVIPGENNPHGLRAIDLAGNTIWETNADAVSIRLAAMGLPPIQNFHHDALVLPDGMILALANSQRQIEGATQDDPPRQVIGDVLVLLNRDFNVRWVWDAFEKLDRNKKAVLGEMQGAAEDWTHGNALQYLPDGNILYSIRHWDWVIKIDFQDGMGSGDIIWRMGQGGDFAIRCDDPWPWFSHQHDAHFDGFRLWVFDNGNTRSAVPGQLDNSRGQVYQIDLDTHIATLELNADLGGFSPALGSAQRLGNGNYQFLSGDLFDPNTGTYSSQSAEVSLEDGNSNIRYIFRTASAAYRTFRIISLYSSGE